MKTRGIPVRDHNRSQPLVISYALFSVVPMRCCASAGARAKAVVSLLNVFCC